MKKFLIILLLTVIAITAITVSGLQPPAGVVATTVPVGTMAPRSHLPLVLGPAPTPTPTPTATPAPPAGMACSNTVVDGDGIWVFGTAFHGAAVFDLPLGVYFYAEGKQNGAIDDSPVYVPVPAWYISSGNWYAGVTDTGWTNFQYCP